MDIRRLEPSEAELFYALRLAGLRESPKAFGSHYDEVKDLSPEEVCERYTQTGENFTLGAFDDNGALVGIAGFRREDRMKNQHKGLIWGMYVAPEARGQGVGHALLATLIEQSRGQDGLEQIHLDVITTQEAARKLYLSHGFQSYAVEKRAQKMDGQYYDLEYMVLDLD